MKYNIILSNSFAMHKSMCFVIFYEIMFVDILQTSIKLVCS